MIKYLTILIASIALVATIVPAVLFLHGSISLAATKMSMLIATISWFISAPLFMWKDKADAETS